MGKLSREAFSIYDPYNDGEEVGRKEARNGKWKNQPRGKAKAKAKAQARSEKQSENPLSKKEADQPTTVPGKSKPQEQEISFENFKTFDPFADVEEEERKEFEKARAKAKAKAKVKETEETEDLTSPIVYEKRCETLIHIRVQQRNKTKALTTIQGLPKIFDQERILRALKKQFHCNGNVVEDAEMGQVIQLQGDQRNEVAEFLVGKEGLDLEERLVRVHGF